MKKLVLLASLLHVAYPCLSSTVSDTGVVINHNTTYAAVQNNRMLFGGTTNNEKDLAGFYSIDKQTNKLALFERIQGNGIKDMTLSGRSVFLSTYTISGGLAALYEYTLDSKHPIKLADIPKTSFAWSLAATDKAVYIGTYPNALLYKWDRVKKKLSLVADVSSQQYIRAMAISGNTLFMAVGIDFQLLAMNLSTGKITNILPKQYTGKFYGYGLKAIDNWLVIETEPGNRVIRYNIKTGKWTEDFKDFKRAVTEAKKPSMTVFNGYNGSVLGYDGTLHKLGNGIYGVNSALDGLSMHSEVVRAGKKLPSPLPYNPVIPFWLSAHGGEIYAGHNAFLAAGKQKNADLESKALCRAGNTLFTARYPGALLYATDMTHFSKQDKLVWDIGSAYKQTRPLGIDCKNNKVAIALQPEYGNFGGGLAVYDTLSGAKLFYPNTNTVMDVKWVEGVPVIGTVFSGSLGTSGNTIKPGTVEVLGRFVTEMDGLKVSSVAVDIDRRRIYAAVDNSKITSIDLDYGYIYGEVVAEGINEIVMAGSEVYFGGKNRLSKFDPDSLEITDVIQQSTRTLAYDAVKNRVLFSQGFSIKQYPVALPNN